MWHSSEDPFAAAAAEEEEALRWTTLQKSPTYIQARTAFFRDVTGELSVIDVTRLKKTS